MNNKNDLLSFAATERKITRSDISKEFMAMKSVLNKPLTPSLAYDIARSSGTHILKAITPRAEADKSVLRISTPGSNGFGELFPSFNPAFIPNIKVIFRPIEVESYPAISVVDAVMNGGDLASDILEAFSDAFGHECLDALVAGFNSGPSPISELPFAEFPIVFAPTPNGGDVQITPISPISSFMCFKKVSSAYFKKRKKGEPPVARGRWTRQHISSQMQNITGKIGGPRQRFAAEMPPTLSQVSAGLHRFVRGGEFPFWYEPELDTRILHYATLQIALKDVGKIEIRKAADRLAGRLIEDALSYIDEILIEANDVSLELGLDVPLGVTPKPSDIIYARHWSESDKVKVRRALTSPHFSRIQNDMLERRGLL